MRFSEYIKTIELEKIGEDYIKIDKIHCQFNPDRFQYWMKCCNGEDIFNIKYSPHVSFLKTYLEHKNKFYIDGIWRNTSYFQLQKLYGRKDEFIYHKTIKFIDTFQSICDNGYNKDKAIDIIRQPVIENPHFDGFEVWEGHHRLAIMAFLKHYFIYVNIHKIRFKND